MDDEDKFEEEIQKEKVSLSPEELQEKIEQTFSHLEFNNEEEDKKVTKEAKWRDYASLRKSLCIIGCVLFGVLLAFVISRIGFHRNNKYSPEREEEYVDTGSYGINHGSLHDNQYIYDYENKVLMDFSFQEIGRLVNKQEAKDLVSYHDSSYFIFMNRGNFDVKRVSDGKIVSFFSSKKSYPIVESDGQIVGAYENTGTELYWFEGGTYRKDSLKSIEIDSIESSRKDTYIYYKNHSITRYDGKYFITVNKSNNPKYGLYDSKSGQAVIRPIYEELCYLGPNRYAAVRDGKVGIIDSASNVISDFQSVTSDSKNKAFFARQVFDRILVMIGSDPMSSDYIYHGPYTSYYLQDNQFIPLNQNFWYDVDVFDHYVIVTNDKEKNSFTVYDSDMNQVSSFVVPGNHHTILGLFFGVLIVKGDNGYSFFDIESGNNLGIRNTFNKEYGEYMLTFQLENNGLGTVIIFQDDKELGKLENASFDHFILNGDDRILVTDDKIIYHAVSSSNSLDGDILIIKK